MKKLGKYLLIILVVASLVYVGYVLEQVQSKAEVASQPELSKYDVGPPDPQEMLELVNEERKKVGVKPLTIDENVQKVAQMKADDMAERNYFDHNIKGTEYTLTTEMAEIMDRSCSSSSENIRGRTITNDSTSRDAIRDWMNSDSHREAIQDRAFSKTGFGVSDTAIVQKFCIAK